MRGIAVVDLTRVLAGPFCTMILADLGAEVIKIERPGRGDDTRAFLPPALKDANGKDTSESAYFLAANRNKRSLSVDLTKPDGQKIILDLILKSDVLVENFKTGDLQKYGLGYDSLKAVNPKLIYCSITGFGQTGPYRERAGYDAMIQAMAGIMSISGRSTAEGGEPTRVGIPVADLMSGLYATIGILSALQHRANTGAGQAVDIALMDCVVGTLANQAMNYLATGTPPGRIGNAHPNIVPYQSFATSDGAIVIAVGNDGQFKRFCEVLGRPELVADERFATNGQRVANRTVLVPILESVMRSKPGNYWFEALEAAGIPCGPINDLAQVFADPHVLARGMRIEMDHPLAGKVPLVGSPLKLSASPVAYHRPPPLLGEHTDEVLAGLGYRPADIAKLKASGVV
ncbi:MAG: CoA transferase [Rhodospirillales bacterium]|nr:CoA transferase [Rhodospirillales bacterium]